MALELLANELLFDLFDYMSDVDLFHSFNGLNNRFDNLLLDYYQNKKSFDFRLILKEDLFKIFLLYIPYLMESKIVLFLFSICSNMIDHDTSIVISFRHSEL